MIFRKGCGNKMRRIKSLRVLATLNLKSRAPFRSKNRRWLVEKISCSATFKGYKINFKRLEGNNG